MNNAIEISARHIVDSLLHYGQEIQFLLHKFCRRLTSLYFRGLPYFSCALKAKKVACWVGKAFIITKE